MRNHAARPVEVLLVEDNPGDVRLMRVAMREGKALTRLSVAADGVEALAFLRREGAHVNAPRPDIILLDLNLPQKNGREVLSEIKADESLRSIPVIVLTTSSADKDILQCYYLHANCYTVKPVDLERFLEVAKSIGDFWFSTVTLPGGAARAGGRL